VTRFAGAPPDKINQKRAKSSRRSESANSGLKDASFRAVLDPGRRWHPGWKDWRDAIGLLQSMLAPPAYGLLRTIEVSV
jgi:hypothetical protein